MIKILNTNGGRGILASTPHIALGECHESGEGASINADRYSEKLGFNVDRRPQAGGLHCVSPNFEE